MTLNADAQKQAAARAAADLVEPGMIVGVGTGSTALHFIRALADRVHAGLDVTTVATSRDTEKLLRDEQIAIRALDASFTLDLAVDGADAFDPRLDLIKGRGGALLREKIVAEASERFVVIVDASKRVASLRDGGRLPVEVVSFGWQRTAAAIERMGYEPTLRVDREGNEFVTDNGNLVLDVRVNDLRDPSEIGARLKALTGVVEHGLFVGIAQLVLVGRADGSVERLARR